MSLLEPIPTKHTVLGNFERDNATLDVRAVCICGEKFEDNDRQTVIDMVADHLVATADWDQLPRDDS